jgi:hypothetical protein
MQEHLPADAQIEGHRRDPKSARFGLEQPVAAAHWRRGQPHLKTPLLQGCEQGPQLGG